MRAPFLRPSFSTCSTLPSVKPKTNKLALGPLLLDNNIVFHSIGNDISRFVSILKNGILSKHSAEFKGFTFPTTNGTPLLNGYNGKYNISVSRPPFHQDSLGYNKGAFNLYAKKGISFVIPSDEVIDEIYTESFGKSKIPGECFIRFEISPTDIKGIMIQKELLDELLSKINFLEDGGFGTIHLRSQYLYNYVIKETSFQEDEEVWLFIQKCCEKNEDKEQYQNLMNNYVAKAFASKGILTLRDFLKKYTPSEVNTYDNFGMKIEL